LTGDEKMSTEHDIRERAVSLAAAAQAAAQRGDRDRALALWRETIELEPHEVHYAIASTNDLAGMGEPSLALDVCAQWIARNPDNALIRVQRGIVYLNNCSDRDSAIECLAEALFIDPDNHDAHAALAQIYLFASQPELMRFHAKQALIRADGKSALRLRGRFLSDHGGVIEQASSMLAAAPGDADIRMMLGKALYMQCRFDEALDAFKRVVESEPFRWRPSALWAIRSFCSDASRKAGACSKDSRAMSMCWRTIRTSRRISRKNGAASRCKVSVSSSRTMRA
jgi:tetratricopeptide (TPR) repeat protein